jgi:predicted ATP-grasp superfamily ATP-dependent carboligase
MQKSTLNVLVLDGESGLTTKVVRSLAAAGRLWSIHVLARSASASRTSLAWSRHVASFRVCTAADDDAYSAAIYQMAADIGAAVILPVTEATALFCIRHRQALERVARLAPLPTAEAFITAIDKGLLGSLLARADVPHPRTCLACDASLTEFRYPLVIKPRRADGGYGIVKVESPHQLEQELRRRASDQLCVQEHIEGADMGCSLLAHQGDILAWTTQQGLRRSRPFSPFSELRLEPFTAVYDVTAKLMRTLNWSGVAHVDLRLDSRTGQPLVLEVNGRFWASLWASTMANVNFPDLACRLALRLPPFALRISPCPSTFRAGRFVQARVWAQDLVRLRPAAFRPTWSGLSGIWHDPLPEVVATLRSVKHALFA